MAGERVSSTLLLGGEGGSEGEFPCCSLVTLVGHLQAASGLLHQRGHLIDQATGQDEPAVQGLLEAAQELWHSPGGSYGRAWTRIPTGLGGAPWWRDRGTLWHRRGAPCRTTARRSDSRRRPLAACPGTGTADRSWPGSSARAAPSPLAAAQCPSG